MKKNFTLNIMFLFGFIFFTTFASSSYAQTSSGCASEKNPVKTDIKSESNIVSTSVVINEVYGGSESGNAYNADFIELYNTSNIPVNISDYSVQYYTAGQINGGAPTSTAHIPDATIIAAFGYYVIRISPADRPGLPLPCENLNASASFAETGIESAGGKLVLTSTGADLADCTSTLNVIDRIGWGITPITCNETTNAQLQVNSISVQRRMNVPDTDNNLADFTTNGSATPCTSLSPTSANVNISGRVSSRYKNISGALVTIFDANNTMVTARTNAFGYFSFTGLSSGQTYVLSTTAKNYSFVTQVITINEDMNDLTFIALEN